MTNHVTSAVGSSTEELIFSLFVELIIIIVASRVVAYVAHRFFAQTKVVGEIIAGVLLGPSFLGLIAPQASAVIFTTSTGPILVGFAQLGLLLLMFQIGMEFEFRRHLEGRRSAVVLISGLGILLPFAGGLAFAWWYSAASAMPSDKLFSFAVFMGVAMSITAIPILGRIFIELDLSHTRIATVTIAAAAIDDVTGWILLGVATALATSGFSGLHFAAKLVILCLYAFGIIKIVGPYISKKIGTEEISTLDHRQVAWILVALLLSALVTSALGVFAIFGAFVLGFSLHDNRRLKELWSERVGPLTYCVFLPVFFAYTGMRTDIGSLDSRLELAALALVISVAFLGKFIGGYAGARIGGESRQDAVVIGFCMNTRALMELIVLNIGYDLGVLPRSVFTMLVIMALVSTIIASPIIRKLLKGSDRHSSAELPQTVRASA